LIRGDGDSGFREGLTDSALHSIGARFTDGRPDIVDDVLAQSEEIERTRPAAWAERDGDA
jgi:hypothetical protein